MSTPTDLERVVLLDDGGDAIGTRLKSEVHGQGTPLHLAFSCYVFDRDGRLLVTRRARSKATFPGLVTNTVCGHPAPRESLSDAVIRRADQELGLTLTRVRLVLPGFRYHAEMDGVVEHEWCPVFAAWLTDPAQVRPDPDEVDAVELVPWTGFVREVLGGERAVSPWCRTQVELLDALGPDPLLWPAGDPAQLPPAARP